MATSPVQGPYGHARTAAGWTYVQAMWAVQRVPPEAVIVSCRLTDNMTQGIHLEGERSPGQPRQAAPTPTTTEHLLGRDVEHKR